jgi:hypothetical protein
MINHTKDLESRLFGFITKRGDLIFLTKLMQACTEKGSESHLQLKAQGFITEIIKTVLKVNPNQLLKEYATPLFVS